MCGLLGLLLGNRSSAPREGTPPLGLTKLADCLWELYSPPNQKVPEVDIIFFHGLQVNDYEDAFWKTWLATDDEQVVWPKDWLSKKLRTARILSVSYNSSAAQIEGQHDIFLLGENLVQDIILTDINIGQDCPVFLVGHCLGGIVIKEFIISAIAKQSTVRPQSREFKRIQTFLDNFKGAFFYATPHGGSHEIEKFASQLKNPSEILRLMKTLNKETSRINEYFSKHRAIWDARTFGMAENFPTTSLGFNGQLVVDASARLDMDEFYTHQADHFTICKARDMEDSAVIGKLTQFISRNCSIGKSNNSAFSAR